MDRKTMEKYLTMYPDIDKEIKRLQDNLDYYATEEEKYHAMEIPEKQKKIMLQIIKGAYASCTKELQEIIKAKHVIEHVFHEISPVQKTNY